MILIDLQKAFDTIDHEFFLMKLECMGFGRSTILWFKSYLNNRTFQVNIEDEYSNPGKLNTCLGFTDKNIKTIESNLNKNFNSLCDWFVENKLSIHFGEDKTKTIIFGSKRRLKGMESKFLNIIKLHIWDASLMKIFLGIPWPPKY